LGAQSASRAIDAAPIVRLHYPGLDGSVVGLAFDCQPDNRDRVLMLLARHGR